jgi:hypothetical protein
VVALLLEQHRRQLLVLAIDGQLFVVGLNGLHGQVQVLRNRAELFFVSSYLGITLKRPARSRRRAATG